MICRGMFGWWSGLDDRRKYNILLGWPPYKWIAVIADLQKRVVPDGNIEIKIPLSASIGKVDGHPTLIIHLTSPYCWGFGLRILIPALTVFSFYTIFMLFSIFILSFFFHLMPEIRIIVIIIVIIVIRFIL